MNQADVEPSVVVTIAGTDPSGGAGINVDLQVCRDWGIHGMAAITAVVWQNTQRVYGWRAMKPGELDAQLAAIGADVEPSAIKIGMLPTVDQRRVVRQWLAAMEPRPPVILDPVMTEGTGDRALTADENRPGWEALVEVVDLVTPNAMEAKILADVEPSVPPEGLISALLEAGWRRVLLKGGHLDEGGDAVVDWFGGPDGIIPLRSMPRLEVDCRGTGCQLSTAIACAMASEQGNTPRWVDGIERSRAYLHDLLHHRCQTVGKGRQIVVRTIDQMQHRGFDIVQ